MSTPVGVPTCYRHSDRETYISCQRCSKPICPDCMRDAAVGFQCPDCVKQGAKETRSGRTAYGGMMPTKPGRVTVTLMGIIAIVWLAVVVSGAGASVLVDWMALFPNGWCAVASDQTLVYPDLHSAAACGKAGDSVWIPGVLDGGVWRLLSHVFTHIEIWHVAMNLLALWQLGPRLEQLLGTARFLALYLISGISGGVAILWLESAGVGASGAWFGLLAAAVLVTTKMRGDLSQWTPTLFLGVVISLIPGISWQGHLGGFLGGLAAGAVLIYAPRENRGRFQAIGLSAISLVLVGATAAAIAVLG